MKKLFLSLIFILPAISSMACPACQAKQPSFLRGITHGTGPRGWVDMIGFWGMSIVVVATLFFSIKWLIKPGEKNPDHIKRFIINND